MTEVVLQATLKETDAGLVPESDGWFVVNARDAPWWRNDVLGQGTEFEGEPGFPEVGFFVTVLLPGQRTACTTASRGRRTFSCCPASAS